MTDRQKTIIRRTSFAFGAIALLLPVTVSPSQGIEGNEACAGATCCRELNSVCDAGDPILNHYNSPGSTCVFQQQP